MEEARKKADGIQGWLTRKEAEFLYGAAKKCAGKGVIVEIGSWKGKSTVWIAYGSRAGGGTPVFAVDPHTGGLEKHNIILLTFYDFKNNIREAGVDGLVTPVVKRSEEAVAGWDRPVEMLFIDGSHEFEDVERDFLLWYPHVVEGGIIIFHDTNAWLQNGPYRVLKKHVLNSPNFKNAGTVDSIFYAEKCSQNSGEDLRRMTSIGRSLSHVDFVNFFYAPLKKAMCALGFNVVDMSYAIYSPWTSLNGFNPPARFLVRAFRRLLFSGRVRKEDGVYKEYYANGRLRREIKNNGQMFHGVSKLYYDDGSVQAELPYVNGYLSGTVREFYRGGRLRSEEDYMEGKPEGKCRCFSEDGTPAGETPRAGIK